MKLLATITLLLFSVCAMAQTHRLQGQVTDTTGNPVVYGTVSLLQTVDSTLAFFGITNEDGQFQLQGITSGTYLMQVSYVGYASHYRTLSIPAQAGNLGRIELQDATTALSEVQVIAEKIPLRIKGDTLEYNPSAFRTKPDASVEDLLKKLPGIEVDRSGNVKAQGAQPVVNTGSLYQ